MEIYIETIKNFIFKNYKTILKLGVGIFIFYWFIFILTPNVRMSEETKAKIDSLNVHIKIIEEDNKKLDTAITLYNKEVEKVDNIINNIKNEKTIIKEFYHEKIISIDNYSSAQIDSFFTNRYRLHP